jgi:hypothetical protein
MAKQVVGELFAVAHIKKYLLKNLDPQYAHTTQNGLTLQRHIAAKLDLRIHLHEEYGRGTCRGPLPLALACGERPDIPVFIHKEIIRDAEALFWQELASTVRQLTPFTHKKRAAVEHFLQQYGITEEDMPIQHVLRLYYRHLGRKVPKSQRSRKRGRPRKEPRKDPE